MKVQQNMKVQRRGSLFQPSLFYWASIAASAKNDYSGETLAFGNMLWLITSSMFEYVGVYNNCRCKSCFANFGDRGWAVLFKTDQDFQRVAQGPWVGGICMSTIVCIILSVLFWAGASRSK
jgi:hypothetical protein